MLEVLIFVVYSSTRSRVLEARILAIVLGSLALRTTVGTTPTTPLLAPWGS